MSGKPPSFIFEGAKRRPVLYDVDVAVAGAGMSATFAAIASARCGARTLVIERFGALGGNMGPGMILGGSIDGEADTTIPGGLCGIAAEFLRRACALQRPGRGRKVQSRLALMNDGQRNVYPEVSSIASFVAWQMLKEAGGEALFSAYAGDPIVKNGRVRGVFVECKGGRAAVLAKVTVDGTGDADVARRAGARMADFHAIASGKGADPRYKSERIPAGMIRDAYMDRRWPEHYDDTMMVGLVAGVDLARHERFLKRPARLGAADRKVVERHFHHLPPAYWPALVKGWRAGTLPIWKKVNPDINVSIGVGRFYDFGGIIGLRVVAAGAIKPSDPRIVSAMEGELRTRVFEGLLFYRDNIPGFENAFLVGIQPFMGTRGGPHMVGDVTLRVKDVFSELRFDDVLYRNIHESNHGGPASGFDVPLRITLPKGVDGLMVCGRGAAYERRGHDPSGMRARPSMMVFGQCVGTVAALAALDGVTPRKVDIRKVQRRLLRDGIPLGEPARLRELGLRA